MKTFAGEGGCFLLVVMAEFEKHEGASSTSHRGAASLQPMYPEMVTYSSSFNEELPV